jgi:hypothetical protein
MTKISRKQALENIKAAGARNDQQAMIRIYTENRISHAAALQAWAAGARQRICGEGQK